LGVIGGAKPRSEGRYKDLLIWVQRGLAWLAIVLALYFRNPGITSFEVFGTLFDLTGSSLQFGLLGIIVIASLFIKRPWCKYLCPLKPVMDLYRTFRKWVMESWKRIRARAAG
jgi:polyferredoxin